MDEDEFYDAASDWSIRVELHQRAHFTFDEITRGWSQSEKEALLAGDLDAEDAAHDAGIDLLCDVHADTESYISRPCQTDVL